ncbi:hypothetical protein R1flu_018012 [Riccia fluitans]|uniref:Reverse transcriptase domain-containing protein n=1 Tax=Riccia fluitans TaxID=41844 RepID=A0ABD1ZI08_9MARC
MSSLQTNGGTVIKNEDLILNQVLKFYTTLYAQPTLTQEEIQEQGKALTLLKWLVFEEDNRLLMALPDEAEVSKAVSDLPSNKAPDEDGLTAEVLREMWSEVGAGCLHFVQEVWRSKRLGKLNSGAIVKLILKSEEKAKLSNWRPISLLNLSYKLAGRILAKRLKELIPKLVDEEQTGFVHGRSITDNIVSLSLCQELAVAKKEPVLFVKLDFVKAFDRVQHAFHWSTMRCMGFGSEIITLTQAFVSEGHARVHMNGRYTKSFKLERGVRQGCPISPLLFSISTQPLMWLLREGEQKGEIEGVSVPKGGTLLHRLFADDSGVAVKAEERNFRNLCKIIEWFEKISGAQLNPAKSVIIPFALEHPLPWLQSIGCQVLNPGQYITYLGCHFGLEKSEEERASDLQKKLQRKLGRWACRFLTWASRGTAPTTRVASTPNVSFLGFRPASNQLQ